MAAAGLIYLLVMLLTAATAAAFVGVPLLAAGGPGARGLGAVDRGPARALPGVERVAMAGAVRERATTA